MPNDANARGVSAGSAVGLFFTTLVLCYLNTTTSGLFGSTAFILAIGATGLAMCAKMGFAFGVESKLASAADRVASLVPWVAVVVNIYQVLHYKNDGMDGFMAGFALLALMTTIAFGLTDSVQSIIGEKFKGVQAAGHEALERARAVREAAAGGRHQ